MVGGARLAADEDGLEFDDERGSRGHTALALTGRGDGGEVPATSPEQDWQRNTSGAITEPFVMG